MGSEWDFTWGLSGQALIDAQGSGATYEEWEEIARQEKREQWEKLKELRDSNQITQEEFKKRKTELFND